MSTRKSATNNGFLIFTDQLTLFKNIPAENIGEAIILLLENFETMEPIQAEPFTNMAYELIATNVRRYREESEQASEFGKKGGGNPTLNPTYKGTLIGTLNPTYKQQDKTIQDNTKQENTREEINNKIDIYADTIINKVFEIYKSHCTELVKLDRFYSRNVELKKLIGSYLEQTESDLEYFTRVCDIANRVKKIGSVNVDLKTILRNHDGFYNGKYAAEEETKPADDWFASQQEGY